jgi:hypothetical protein
MADSRSVCLYYTSLIPLLVSTTQQLLIQESLQGPLAGRLAVWGGHDVHAALARALSALAQVYGMRCQAYAFPTFHQA